MNGSLLRWLGIALFIFIGLLAFLSPNENRRKELAFPSSTVSSSTTNFKLVMTATKPDFTPVDSNLEAYFVISRGLTAIDQREVLHQKQTGTNNVVFDDSRYLDTRSHLGIYVPSGYKASYMYTKTYIQGGQCNRPSYENFFSHLIPYLDTTRRDRSKIHPLLLGGNDAAPPGPDKNLPSIAANECLYINWVIEEGDNFSSIGAQVHNYSQFEELSLAVNSPNNLSGIQTIEGISPVTDGARVELSVSEDFGGVAKTLKVATGSRSYTEILVNGAPTDDGLIWGIPSYNNSQLYDIADTQIDTAVNGFVGHTAVGSPYSNTMWGMKVPFEEKGTSLYNYLQFDSTQCESNDCWIPMQGDFDRNQTNGRVHESTPFYRLHSTQPWVGKIERLALGVLKNPDETRSGVVRFLQHYKYRPHRNFTAHDGHKPHLWFNQDLRHQPDLHLVFDDGTTTFISGEQAYQPFDVTYNTSTNRYNPISPSTVSQMNQLWEGFCDETHLDPNWAYCAENPNQGDAVTCRCSDLDRVKRVIYHYSNQNVAVAVEIPGQNFAHYVLTTVYRDSVGFTPFILLSAAANDTRGDTVQFTTDQSFEERYWINVGTLDELNRMGLGI